MPSFHDLGDADADFLVDDDDDFDPLADMDPLPGTPDGEPIAVPTGTPAEIKAEWGAVDFLATEKGAGDGYTFQRYRDAKGHYAKVVFTFTEQPPPHGRIESAAGSVWELHTTEVKRKTITALYLRRTA